MSPPEAAGLLLRDVEILRPGHVLVMSIGEAGDSRIFRTTDGGRTWTQPFVNDDPDAFYDCMAMWPGGKRGLAMSDPVDGKFRIIETTRRRRHLVGRGPGRDARRRRGRVRLRRQRHLPGHGRAPRRLPRLGRRRVPGLPLPRPRAHLDGRGLHHPGRRRPVACSRWPSAAPRQVLAVGGDFTAPDNGVDMSAYSHDRGRSWTNGGDLGGYRSGVDWLSRTRATAVAVGPTGSDITLRRRPALAGVRRRGVRRGAVPGGRLVLGERACRRGGATRALTLRR